MEEVPLVEVDKEQRREAEEGEIQHFEEQRLEHEEQIRRLRMGQLPNLSDKNYSLLTPLTQETMLSPQAIQEQMLAMMKLLASTQASLAAVQQQSAGGMRSSQTPGLFVSSSSSRLKLNPPQEFTGSKPESLRQFIMQ